MTIKTKTAKGCANIYCELGIYINDVLFDDYVVGYKFTEKMNELPQFECDLSAVEAADRATYLKQGINVQLRAGDTLVFPKMMIRTAEHKTDLESVIKGWGFTESLMNDKLTETTTSSDSESQAGRPQYTSIATNTIVSEQVALVTGVSVNTNANVKPITIRGENDTVLSFLAGCADVAGGDWWASYGTSVPYTNNYFNSSNSTISGNYHGRGSDKSGSVIFAISGGDQNFEVSSREADYDSMYNYVKVFGYGDGINQLESHAFHATSTRTYLASDLSASDVATAYINSATNFPSSGSVWIGCEKISYTSLWSIDGFEYGTLNTNPIWAQTGETNPARGAEEIQTAVKKNGTYAYHWENITNPVGSSNYWTRTTDIIGDVSNGTYNFDFWMQKSAWAARSSVKDVVLLDIRHASGTVVAFGAIDNQVYSSHYDGKSAYTVKAFSAATWYRYRITFTTDGTNTTTVTLKVFDEAGAEQHTETHAMDASAPLPTKVQITCWSDTSYSYGGAGSTDVYFDDVTFGYASLSGLTRGVAFLGTIDKAYAHSAYSPVYDAQYTTGAPQAGLSGSSINSNGLKEHSMTDRTIIDQSALDILAERMLLDHIGVKH